MAGMGRRQALPLARILPSHVAAFSKVIVVDAADTVMPARITRGTGD